LNCFFYLFYCLVLL